MHFWAAESHGRNDSRPVVGRVRPRSGTSRYPITLTDHEGSVFDEVAQPTEDGCRGIRSGFLPGPVQTSDITMSRIGTFQG
ncbi:hypothetical protein GCM10009642_14160 [Nocardiopsis metallicus]